MLNIEKIEPRFRGNKGSKKSSKHFKMEFLDPVF
jgi:hypothetical protein